MPRKRRARRDQRDQTAPETGAVLTIGPDIVVPIPDVPESEAGPRDAESLAVAAAFNRLVADGRLRKTPGPGEPAADVLRELGVPLPDDQEDPASGEAPAPAARGQLHIRVPVSLRQELAARARSEGVSLNALVLAYLARGLSSPWGPPPGSKD
jgi:HicB family